MYVVKFIRKDGQPDELYYYRRKEDAEYHLHLFDADDSGLYSGIVLFKEHAPSETASSPSF